MGAYNVTICKDFGTIVCIFVFYDVNRFQILDVNIVNITSNPIKATDRISPLGFVNELQQIICLMKMGITTK